MRAMLKAMEGTMATQVKHVSAVHPRHAEGLVRDVYAQMRRDMMVAGPFTLHSPCPELLAGAWAVVRESLVARGVPRAKKERVAHAVSELNTCAYCADVHSMASQLSIAGDASAEDALSMWASSTLSPGEPILSDPPFTAEEAPQIIGTALAFHYINRMVNVFLDEQPMPGPRFMQGAMRLMSKPVMRPVVRIDAEPGASIRFLPAVDSSPARSRATVDHPATEAFARLEAAADRAVHGRMSERVRGLVEERLDAWTGRSPGLGRVWVAEATADLDAEDRPVATLALLAACASHQVDAGVVERLRAAQEDNGDAALVAVASWASIKATRRIGTWITGSHAHA